MTRLSGRLFVRYKSEESQYKRIGAFAYPVYEDGDYEYQDKQA